MSILTSLALLGGATFALFSDTATSVENTFSTGNASLPIANDVESPGLYGDSIAGVSFSDIAPGFSEDKDFWLKNNSDGDFEMDVTVDLASIVAGPDLGDDLMVGFRCDTDQDGLGTGDTVIAAKSVNTWGTDPAVDLATIGAHQDPEVGAGDVSDQDELLCRMTASLDVSVGDEVAGESVTFDGVFDGTQVLLL